MIIDTILTIVLVAITAISTAAAHTLKDHFDISIFSRYKREFWDPLISWRNKYIDRDPAKGRNHKFVPFTDAWHMLNSLTISAFLVFPLLNPYILIHPILTYVLLGIIHILTFNLFYNHIFLKKTK